MKLQAQRIAIAEACGWKNINATGLIPVGMHPEYIKAGKPAVACIEALPDYPSDLNAMHWAERILIEQGFARRFTIELANICVRDGFELALWNCTAPQKAEAFLRAIGKWDSENSEVSDAVRRHTAI